MAKKGVTVVNNLIHIAFKQALKKQAQALGFDYQDQGYIVIIGLGDTSLTQSEQRIGVVTHGDVQPVDASKWAQSPFKLDDTSEQGKLLTHAYFLMQ
ncbi:MAG: hypothetical protein COB35_01060 [Gammaproteobacteria bacterium]|nr:MAG: hypothetical protein COB35_01060 [Gammaproteobacteria bacterium]